MQIPALQSIASVSGAGRDAFVAQLGDIFEHSPWVAERAYAKGPFASVDALHAGLMQCVREAAREEQLALLRAHPELAGREAAQGALTADSSSEQSRLGFTALSREELERVEDINRRYRERFGFPCIVALALHSSRASVLAEMERRIGSEPGDELAAALEQIGHIARARLAKSLGE